MWQCNIILVLEMNREKFSKQVIKLIRIQKLSFSKEACVCNKSRSEDAAVLLWAHVMSVGDRNSPIRKEESYQFVLGLPRLCNRKERKCNLCLK